MGEGCPERCIIDVSNTRVEETEWGMRRMEAPFEGGQGPEGAAAMDNLRVFSVFVKQWDQLECHKIVTSASK